MIVTGDHMKIIGFGTFVFVVCAAIAAMTSDWRWLNRQQPDVQQEVVRRAKFLQDFDHVPTGTLIALHKEAVLMVALLGQLVDACRKPYNPSMFLNIGVVARSRVVAQDHPEYPHMLGLYYSKICK